MSVNYQEMSTIYLKYLYIFEKGELEKMEYNL